VEQIESDLFGNISLNPTAPEGLVAVAITQREVVSSHPSRVAQFTRRESGRPMILTWNFHRVILNPGNPVRTYSMLLAPSLGHVSMVSSFIFERETLNLSVVLICWLTQHPPQLLRQPCLFIPGA
jgi:hypothetical protein